MPTPTPPVRHPPACHLAPPRLLARWALGLLAAATLLAGTAAQAQTVRCHLSYAGASRIVLVPPTVCPADVTPVVEGSSFALRVINAAGPAGQEGVTIETFAAVGGQWLPTHRAHYSAWEAHTTQPGTPHGFTGLQAVQSPQHALPLAYWCERVVEPEPTAPRCGR